jgi:hypothetical protein
VTDWPIHDALDDRAEAPDANVQRPGGAVTVDDLSRMARLFADLADDAVMHEAWR